MARWSVAGGIDTLDDLLIRIKTQKLSSADAVLGILDESMRTNYALVYQSRSPHKASLAEPRIVLASRTGDFFVGIAGGDGGTKGEVIETISFDGIAPKFTRISFEGGTSVIDHSNKSCAVCHGRVKDGKSSEFLRPIWDGYPDWPGVFGTSHNGLKTNKGYGTSGLDDFKFEAAALGKLKFGLKNSKYRHLIGLGEASLFELSVKSTAMTGTLLRFQNLGLISLSREKIRGMTVPEQRSLNEFLEQPLTAELREKWLGRVVDSQKRYYSGKLERLKRLAERFGTTSDRQMIEGNSFYKRWADESPGFAAFGFPDSWQPEEQNGYFLYLEAVERLGIDTDLIGTNREVGSLVTTHGNFIDDYAKAWIQEVRDYLTNPTASLNCKELLSKGFHY